MAVQPPRLYGDPEFLGEHFDFLPASLMNELYDKYNLIFYKMLDALSKYVQEMPTLSDDQIQKLTSTMENDLCKILDTTYSDFERYVYDHILHLPPNLNMQLEHYKGLDLESTEEMEQFMDDQLDALRKKIVAKRALRTMLHQSHADIDREIKSIERNKDVLYALGEATRKENVYPLSRSMQSLSEHGQLLRRSVVDALDRIHQNDHVLEQLGNRERLKYHAQMVREALDNFRQSYA
ncbi:hypothetical protein BCR43DRAFT_485133 [Syncephalastrum racemosum]|uniref:Mis12 protein-domain-containing protein n=1 Tax=Syncephalastrum racemosum TaxID=13706 RepID=A0A1X2HNE0_SYNRA|nr:hypothetical protein BCR43DRAFT_485133 [Syncephalastrum racemosum]